MTMSKTSNSSTEGLAERLAFIGITASELADLKQSGEILGDILGPALDAFYAKVGAQPQTADMFSSPAHVASAKARQVKHWHGIIDGKFDADYIRAVSTVGNVHARIGLEPRWYIGGYAVLLGEMIKGVIATRCAGLLNRTARKKLEAELPVIVKAALLDMDYAISVYLERLEEARHAAEREKEAQNASREAALGRFNEAMGRLAKGDLESRLGDSLPPEFRTMSRNYDMAVGNLAASLGEVRTSTENTLVNTAKIAESTDSLSRRTEQQAASLEESSAALHQLTQSVLHTTSHAKSAAALVNETRIDVQKSGEVMKQAVSAMNELAQSSTQIANIIAVIDRIAFQTNLLALNAGVEAARAGEAGKGFAVVAQEVRDLAQRSAAAAKEIESLITRSTQQVSLGVDVVGRTGEALDGVIGRFGKINELVSGIAASASEQSEGLREINMAIEHLDGITQQNSAMVQETSMSTVALQEEVDRLVRSMHGFNTGDAAHAQDDHAARSRAA